MQNKAVKIVGGDNYRNKATFFLFEIDIFKEDLLLFENTLFVFKLKIKSLHIHLDNYMRKVILVSIKITRATHKDNYFIFPQKTSKAQKSIKYQEPIIWNSLDANIKKSYFLKSFKVKLKESLLNKYIQ